MPAAANIYDAAPDNCPTVAVISFGEWLGQIEGNFDVLKMDCEGAEWEIFRQMDSQQSARFQIVVVEVHFDPEKLQAVADFKPTMEKLGFETVRWDNKAFGLYVGRRKGKS